MIQELEPVIPIPLTSAKGPGLTTLKIEYNDDLPEYPTSHIDGYSYVVASRGRSQLEMEQLAHDVSDHNVFYDRLLSIH